MGSKSDQGGVPKKQWTLLYYGAGDNDLADAIKVDLNELEAVGSSSQVNLVAFYDLGERGAARTYLERDDDRDTLHSPSKSLGPQDSGNARTLADFLRWGIASFPAQHYAIVVSSHGGGDTRRTAFDYTAGTSMPLRQLRTALTAARQTANQPIDVFVGDACLLQTVELTYELRNDVSIVVASENEVPATGFPYDTILEELRKEPTRTPEDLAGTFVREFGRSQPSDEPTSTMSAIVTQKMPAVADAVVEMFDAIAEEHVDAARQAALTQAYRPPMSVEPGVTKETTDLPSDAYIDVRDMALFLGGLPNETLAKRVDRLQDALNEALIAHYAGPDVPDAYGVTVFFPRTAPSEEDLDEYRDTKFARDYRWTKWIDWLKAVSS